MIIRPDPEDPTNSTKMSVMLQNDVKGWIPHFVVNAFAAKAPVEWHDSLASYYSRVYSQRGKTEEGDSTQEGQSTTEEGPGDGGKDAETQGQSADVAEGGEAKGQSTDTEGGESQVVSEKADTEDQSVTVEVAAEIKEESADTAGGAGEQGEAPAESEANDVDESSKTEATAEQ